MRSQIFSLLALSFGAPFVEQADFWWQKSIESNVVVGASPLPPMFQPNGDIVVVSPDDPGRIAITYLTSAGTVKRSVFSTGQLGSAALDRAGKLYLVRMGEAGATMRLSRYSVDGEPEMEKSHPMGESPLPIGLLMQRSGDLFVAGVGAKSGLGFVGQLGSEGQLAWGKPRGSGRLDAWKPVSMAVFQSGNVLVAGDGPSAEGRSGIRVIKYAPDGKEMLSVALPGEAATVVSCGVDAENDIVVLGKSTGGGAVLWSLDGASGLVNWKEEKLVTPGIAPVALQLDPRKYILVLLNNTTEAVTRSYVVRYSLGGEPMINFQPMEEANLGVAITQDVNGENYVATKWGTDRGAVGVFRTANNLNSRYGIRYHFPHPMEAVSMAVRDEDGAGVVVGLSGTATGPRKPVVLKFRQAPVAKYDTYKVPAGQPFEAPVSVLANDQYVDGAEMRMTQNPKSGSVELRKDGTFLYKPMAGFKGKDTFRYQLSRGSLFWYAAVVTLDVE